MMIIGLILWTCVTLVVITNVAIGISIMYPESEVSLVIADALHWGYELSQWLTKIEPL